MGHARWCAENDAIWIEPKKPRLHLDMAKLLEIFCELSSTLSKEWQFFAQENVLQNLRHKSVDFQCKKIELTPWDISILYLVRIFGVFWTF